VAVEAPQAETAISLGIHSPYEPRFHTGSPSNKRRDMFAIILRESTSGEDVDGRLGLGLPRV
jgi:hypothetical protein